jgi:hypothetical protein
MKLRGDGLVDKIYTRTRTFVPAFLLPLLLAHIEHKKNRAPTWTKPHLLLVSHRAWLGCPLDRRLIPVPQVSPLSNQSSSSASSTPPNRELAVVVDALIGILLNEAQTLAEPVYPAPFHQMPSLPCNHH